MLALILMVQAAQELPATPRLEQDDEIVVVAQKLSNRWKGSVETRDDKTTCKTIRSTGDAEFDEFGCQAMLTCSPQYWPQIRAHLQTEVDAGRVKTKEDMQRMQTTDKLRTIYRSFGACIMSKLRPSIRDLIKQRKAQRG